VVVQVPDFGDRFWVYQVVDQRTDAFASLGKMYGTKPGFYLLAGADWKGDVPGGISAVFRCSTRLGAIFPRVFQSDEPADKKAVQAVLSGINAYPLAEFDGRMRSVDWSKSPTFPGDAGSTEVRWVHPDRFVEDLGTVLEMVPPMPGEEALHAEFRSVLRATSKDARLRAAFTEAAVEAERELVTPLFQFHNYGLPLTENWTTIINGAEWGTDYFTRAAVAKSNIFVNKAKETRYFYQDLDAKGEAAERGQRLRRDLPGGAAPAGGGLLVAHALQRAPLLPPERPRALLARDQEQGAQIRPRRLADHPRPGEEPRGRQGVELAPGPGGRFLALHPGLLAQGRDFRGEVVTPGRVPVRELTRPSGGGA
jgi:hypothetical protein